MRTNTDMSEYKSGTPEGLRIEDAVARILDASAALYQIGHYREACELATMASKMCAKGDLRSFAVECCNLAFSELPVPLWLAKASG